MLTYKEKIELCHRMLELYVESTDLPFEKTFNKYNGGYSSTQLYNQTEDLQSVTKDTLKVLNNLWKNFYNTKYVIDEINHMSATSEYVTYIKTVEAIYKLKKNKC